MGERMLRSFSALLLSMLLIGCQSSMLRSFEKIHLGMDKHQVLDSMGSPNATGRLHGKDRWIYRFYEGSARFDKEIHFLDGVTVYVGDTYAPPADRSAEALDKNASEAEMKAQNERDEMRKKFRSDYDTYQNSAKNADKVRYMPSFNNLD